MKKKIGLAVCLAAGMGLFVACGDSKDGNGSNSSNNTNNKNNDSGSQTKNPDTSQQKTQTLTRQTLVDGTKATMSKYETACKAMSKKAIGSSTGFKIVMFMDPKKTTNKPCTSWETACKSVADVEKQLQQAGVPKNEVFIIMGALSSASGFGQTQIIVPAGNKCE